MAIEGTIKQRKALAILSQDTTKSLGQAMREAGYSKVSANKPSKLTNSKGFQALVNKYLPDSKLLEVHAQGLEATKVISAVVTGKDADEKTNDFIDVPDYATRHKYLETGYKLKGKLEHGPTVFAPTQINFGEDRTKYAV